MARKPVYVASDAHLGAAPPEREAAFLQWLCRAGDLASEVVLNGDVFDFWFEYRAGVPKGHERVLGLLRELVEGGVPVTMMGGNHDWWGGRFLREEVGIDFLQEPVLRVYSGFRTWLAHGDGLGKGDLGYRLLKGVLRGRLTRTAFSLLTPEMGARVAAKVSRTDHRYGEPTDADQDRARALEAWAVAQLRAEAELDLVLLGHAHVPARRAVAPGRWYVNSGDWVRHCSYVVLTEGAEPQLIIGEA